jgi:hypothetical protein
VTLLPESVAAERIAAAVSPHLSPAWLTERCIRDLCLKIVSHRDFVRAVFDELDQDPKRIGDRGDLLKQQATASMSDEDAILERLHHLRSEESYLNACLTAMGSVYAPSLVDRDEVAADADDRRLSEEAAAERAVAGAPRVRAS